MNWLKKIFGGGRKKKSSSRSSSRAKSKSRSKTKSRAKTRQSRRRSSAASTRKKPADRSRKTTSDSSMSKRLKGAKQESGQTFSNAFNLAKRELPGIREADAAFRPTAPREFEPEEEAAAPVSLGQAGSGRAPGIRRPN